MGSQFAEFGKTITRRVMDISFEEDRNIREGNGIKIFLHFYEGGKLSGEWRDTTQGRFILDGVEYYAFQHWSDTSDVILLYKDNTRQELVGNFMFQNWDKETRSQDVIVSVAQ